MSNKLSLKKDIICPDCGELIKKGDKSRPYLYDGEDKILHVECIELLEAEKVRRKEAEEAMSTYTPDNEGVTRHLEESLPASVTVAVAAAARAVKSAKAVKTAVAKATEAKKKAEEVDPIVNVKPPLSLTAASNPVVVPSSSADEVPKEYVVFDPPRAIVRRTEPRPTRVDKSLENFDSDLSDWVRNMKKKGRILF